MTETERIEATYGSGRVHIKRKAPETIQEHKDEAIRQLSFATRTNPFGEQHAAEAMRRARRHVEAAELLARLADLHN